MAICRPKGKVQIRSKVKKIGSQLQVTWGVYEANRSRELNSVEIRSGIAYEGDLIGNKIIK